MQTVVVDYEAGNLRSVETALRHIGQQFTVTSDPEQVRTANRVIFPGVGEARASMDVLNSSGIGQAILDFVKTGKPMLGICIGCQVALEKSEERDTSCLGIIPGEVKRFPQNLGLKIPHMGWNQVHHDGTHKIFEGIPSGASFYFVHSYYPAPAEKSAEICHTDYGIDFTSGLEKENVVVFQFHPEKSGEYGLKLLSNFFSID